MDDFFDFIRNFFAIVGIVFLSSLVLLLTFFVVCIPFAIIAESEYKAKFLNEKHGTNYSTSDMFWRGGAIMEMNAYLIPEKPKTITLKKGE